jgi:hypothetical protein
MQIKILQIKIQKKAYQRSGFANQSQLVNEIRSNDQSKWLTELINQSLRGLMMILHLQK